MSTALIKIGGKLAERFGMGSNTAEVLDILKNTAFKGGNVTDAQMTSLMIVADQYGLNPWTREIYAFPDKGGIVPVVGVDGWSRIINEHPQFDGMEFEQGADECTCIMYRKDRSHPVRVTEFLEECKRNTQPWSSHPRRMLRHKALIQCARLAFGFVGIYDQDEAERIVEKDMGTIDGGTGEILSNKTPTLPAYTDAQLVANIPAWQAAIDAGKSSPQKIIAMISTRFVLSPEQADTIRNLVAKQPEPKPEIDPFVAAMDAAGEPF